MLLAHTEPLCPEGELPGRALGVRNASRGRGVGSVPMPLWRGSNWPKYRSLEHREQRGAGRLSSRLTGPQGEVMEVDSLTGMWVPRALVILTMHAFPAHKPHLNLYDSPHLQTKEEKHHKITGIDAETASEEIQHPFTRNNRIKGISLTR